MASQREQGINPKDAIGLTKPPLRLLPAAALLFLARVLGLGAKKYGPYNWRTAKVRYTVYLEAAMRHILSALDGEEIDPESGQPHAAHAMACMAILLDAKATGNLVDDRPTPGVAASLIKELTETPAGSTEAAPPTRVADRLRDIQAEFEKETARRQSRWDTVKFGCLPGAIPVRLKAESVAPDDFFGIADGGETVLGNVDVGQGMKPAIVSTRRKYEDDFCWSCGRNIVSGADHSRCR